MKSLFVLPSLENSGLPASLQQPNAGRFTGILAKALCKKGILKDRHFESSAGILSTAVELALLEWCNNAIGERSKNTDMAFYFTDDVDTAFTGLETSAWLSSKIGRPEGATLGGFGFLGSTAPELIVGHRVEQLELMRKDLGWHLLKLAIAATSCLMGVWSFGDALSTSEHNDNARVKSEKSLAITSEQNAGLELLLETVPLTAFNRIDINQEITFFSANFRMKRHLVDPNFSKIADSMIEDAREILRLWDTLPDDYNHLCWFTDIVFMPICMVRWSSDDCMSELFDDWKDYHHGEFAYAQWQFIRAWTWPDSGANLQGWDQLHLAIVTTETCMNIFRLAYGILQDLHHDCRLSNTLRVQV